MRLRIIFLLKNRGSILPFHHQHLIAQLLKGLLLKGGDRGYFGFTHFNFSGLKGQTKVSRLGLQYLSQKVTLVISSGDQNFLNYLLAQIFKNESLQLGILQLIPESVEKEILPEFSSAMKYICISPLVIKIPEFDDPESKRFIHPENEMFSDLLFESTISRMADFGAYSNEELKKFTQFQVVADKEYLRKIEEGQKKFARIYAAFDYDVKFEVRGYTFPFTLFADPEVQSFIFNFGLGAFTHKGFGMVDLANQAIDTRTLPYPMKEEVV